jgi:hypothetical protein
LLLGVIVRESTKAYCLHYAMDLCYISLCDYTYLDVESRVIVRYKRFIKWYHVLRKDGNTMGVCNVGPWYSRYSKLNCICWAWANSGTHTIDGKNL